jgi:3-methyladenine DNA glycosylase AlkD
MVDAPLTIKYVSLLRHIFGLVHMAVDNASMDVDGVIKRLESMANADAREGMARYGINVEKAFCVSMPELRKLANELKKDHGLALELWDSGYHEAKILAGLIDDHRLVTEEQMDRWAAGFDSWDVCDQCCSNLFDKTQYAYGKALAWTQDEREFVRRAGYVLMATLAVHDKKAPDKIFELFFPFIMKGSVDERNFVKKAVNWALRQIGKRNVDLNKKAIEVARQIQSIDSKSARWIAGDALRELQSPAVQKKLKKHKSG